MVPIASCNLKMGAIAQKNSENKATKQQSKVGKESKAKKYQLHIPGNFWNFMPEVHERSHIAGVSLPPMHLQKAPPKKK